MRHVYLAYVSIIAILVVNAGGIVYAAKPLLINLHGIKEIKDIAECNLDKWGQKAEDACECCLLEKQNELGSAVSADTIIKACKETRHCNDAALTVLRKKEGMIKGTSEELLMALYNDAIVVRTMNIDTSLLNTSGFFSESSLPTFLAQAYKEKKISNADFSKAECLHVKNIGQKGGDNTTQLFLVTSTCKPSQASMYIIKGTREGLDEAIKLKEIELVPGIKEILAPRVVAGLPSIALPIAYFSYPDKSTLQYIAAMPAAKGKEVGALFAQFMENRSAENKAQLSRAFHVLGKETAAFHKRFMKPIKGKILGLTMVHGDFHMFNVFFDKIGAHYTFIDNETMAKSIQNRVSPFIDVLQLFNFMGGSDSDEDSLLWYETMFKPFIKGYSQVYPTNQQKKVLAELKDMANNPSTIVLGAFKDAELAPLDPAYINPIFDSLIQEK